MGEEYPRFRFGFRISETLCVSYSGQRGLHLANESPFKVLDADWNAALNILSDREIGLWTPFKEVKSILLRRTGQIKWLGLLNPDSSCIHLDINGERITSNLIEG